VVVAVTNGPVVGGAVFGGAVVPDPVGRVVRVVTVRGTVVAGTVVTVVATVVGGSVVVSFGVVVVRRTIVVVVDGQATSHVWATAGRPPPGPENKTTAMVPKRAKVRRTRGPNRNGRWLIAWGPATTARA
jgi:hypothetical protein